LYKEKQTNYVRSLDCRKEGDAGKDRCSERERETKEVGRISVKKMKTLF